MHRVGKGVHKVIRESCLLRRRLHLPFLPVSPSHKIMAYTTGNRTRADGRIIGLHTIPFERVIFNGPFSDAYEQSARVALINRQLVATEVHVELLGRDHVERRLRMSHRIFRIEPGAGVSMNVVHYR